MRDSAELVATHKGWFLFCPVFVDMTDADAPGVWARCSALEPLLTLAHWGQLAMMSVLSLMDPDYEPAWMIRLTGQVRTGAPL